MATMSEKLAALKAKVSAGNAASTPTAAIQSPAQSPAPVVRASVLTANSNLPTELQEKVLALETAMLERHPRMPVLLSEIYKTLRAQPENVTLMSEEEIYVVVESLKIQTGTEFAIKAAKSSTKGLKNATPEMF